MAVGLSSDDAATPIPESYRASKPIRPALKMDLGRRATQTPPVEEGPVATAACTQDQRVLHL